MVLNPNPEIGMRNSTKDLGPLGVQKASTGKLFACLRFLQANRAQALSSRCYAPISGLGLKWKLESAIVVIFFACLLALGIGIYKDYGLSWDECLDMNRGQHVYDYVVKGDLSVGKYFDFHGYVFDEFSYLLEKAMGIDDISTFYLTKYLLNYFLYISGIFCFYFLCRNTFKNWKTGLLGALFLVLSPRIFSDAFYNPQDLPFLSFFIIAIYTLVRYLDNKTYKNSAWHALACALAIDSRTMGVMLPCLTLVYSVADLIRFGVSKENLMKLCRVFLFYSISMVFFVIFFWPAMWDDPFRKFLAAFLEMEKYPWDLSILYLGRYYHPNQLPWHYLLLWIAISTPILYISGFIFGVVGGVSWIFKRSCSWVQRRDISIFLLWFFLPIGAIIVLRPNIYDTWRHVFFIYPALIWFALMGLKCLWNFLGSISHNLWRKSMRTLLLALAVFDLGGVGHFMVHYHPFQNLYFNALIGGVKGAKYSFELDYWGVSYRKGLEFIVQNDPRDQIRINAWNSPGQDNAKLLPAKDRGRLVFVDSPESADYFVSNYRWHEKEHPYSKEVFSVRICGVKIMVVYKLSDVSTHRVSK